MSKKVFPIQSETACQLKWTWSSVYLYEGTTASCHRSSFSTIDENNFKDFHNTEKKLKARQIMLDGNWPTGGCEYCQNIEKAGGSSDRMLHNKIPNLTPPELDNNLSAINVTPRILEIYLNNTCNLSCVYCHGGYSSRINHENIKFNSSSKLNIDEFHSFRIFEDHHQKLITQFWDWMHNNSQILTRLHVLGGEPFYQVEFDQLLDYFESNPHPALEFNVVTNLAINKSKLEAYIERFKNLIATKKLKRLDMTCSLDCWGPEQEYARYGLDLSQWVENFEYLLTFPWLILNINQAITPLGIKTMPALIEKINGWKKIKTVNQFFSTSPIISYTFPNIFGGDVFREDFKKILQLMPENSVQEQEAKIYMQGIWKEIEASPRNDEEIKKLITFLDEIDRRRGTDWKSLFPWIETA